VPYVFVSSRVLVSIWIGSAIALGLGGRHRELTITGGAGGCFILCELCVGFGVNVNVCIPDKKKTVLVVVV